MVEGLWTRRAAPLIIETRRLNNQSSWYWFTSEKLTFGALDGRMGEIGLQGWSVRTNQNMRAG